MSVQLSTAKVTTKAATGEVYYPETDGKPMAESDLHRDVMFYIIHVLQRYFAGRRVYVSGNLLLYYKEGDPTKVVAPDCFVVWDVDPHPRRIYKLWEEGQGPQVVFEVTSRSTRREDYGSKMRLYAQLGVEEYYLYDPTAEYMDPPLAGFQLVGGGYVPMEPVNGEVQVGDLAFVPEAGEPPEYISPRLRLRLALDEHNQLRFYDLATGERLLSDEEARQQAEQARQQAEQARQRAEQARQQAEQARQQAEQAQQEAERARREAEERAAQIAAENARLREELARLQDNQPTDAPQPGQGQTP